MRRRVIRAVSFFGSKQTGLLLILSMGVSSLLGTLISQAPDTVRNSPQGYAVWLETMRPRFGDATDLLSQLGLFTVFSSPWFRAIALLLCVSIIAATVQRLPVLWAHAVRGHVAPDRLFAQASPSSPPSSSSATTVMSTTATVAETVAVVTSTLRARRLRVVPAHDRSPDRENADRPAAQIVYADQFRFLPLGTVLSHASFVLIILGVVVTNTGGFRENQFPVVVGSSAAIGHGTDLVVSARSFTDTYDSMGRPTDYASELVLLDGGHPIAEQTVQVNAPLRAAGVSIHQSYFGVAVTMRVQDAAGATLTEPTVPLQWSLTDDHSAMGILAVPGRPSMVYLAETVSGRVDPTLAPGFLRVVVVGAEGAQPVGAATIAQGQSATIDGLTYTFVRERQFTGLMVVRDPGAPIVWVGAGLMVIGLITTLFFRPRRVWVEVRPATDPAHGTTVVLASAASRDPSARRWADGLAGELSTRLAAAAPVALAPLPTKAGHHA